MFYDIEIRCFEKQNVTAEVIGYFAEVCKNQKESNEYLADIVSNENQVRFMTIIIDDQLCAISLFHWKDNKYQLRWELINHRLSEEKRKMTVDTLKRQYKLLVGK